MAIYETMTKAMQDGDGRAYLGLLHDDYQFVRHQSGQTMTKADMAEMIKGMMDSGQWSISDQRCLYENDDVLVSHSIMSFPDGSREALMSVNMKKDGKIIRTETGATPLES